MRRLLGISRKKQSAKGSTGQMSPAPVAPNAVLTVAAPTTLVASASHKALPPLPQSSGVNCFDVTLDLAITACKTIKEIGDTIPGKVGGPIKGTFGILILVLETIKRCRDNREGWGILAEIIIEKNKRVEALLHLYATAPEDHPNALGQASNYQRVLDIITKDMKKETGKASESAEGLELYWSKMKTMGREAALSNINGARIKTYQDQLRTIVLDVIEETSLRDAVVNVKTYGIVKKLAEQIKPTGPTSTLKPRPLVVEDFVGREDILGRMSRTHFVERSTRRSRPIITVLTGMGGSGKTQIAVKFAEEFEEKFPGVPVYFLNASSDASLETDLKTLTGSQSASYEDALTWLATGIPNWLLILDNADKPSLDLSKYLPHSPHGHIIITTRNETHKVLSPRSTLAVDALSLDEATNLLLHSSGSEDNEANRILAKDIVEEVGRLPLAISHAATYICVHGQLDAYLEMYRKSQIDFLNKRPIQAYGYSSSVGGAIQISYDCLSPEAKLILQIFSYLDIQSIPQCIIERAVEQGFAHVPYRTELPLNPDTVENTDALQSLFCPEGEWSKLRFNGLVVECLKYSLLRSTVIGEVYSMHPLVQTYLHSTSSFDQGRPPQRLATRLLASSIVLDDEGRHFIFNRVLLPHIRLVPVESVTEAGDHYGFGDVLNNFGDGLAIAHLQRCVGIWRNLLGPNHLDTLKAMNNLAGTYQLLGKAQDASQLQEEVLEKRRMLLGPDHLDTLAAMNNLANTYQSLGKTQDALPLREEVLEKRRMLLGPDHLDTLKAINNLAGTYQLLGKVQDALPLQEEVLEKRRRLLGPDHLDTLMAMNNLANTYQSLGKAQDALPLKEEVLEKRRKVLGNDHRSTLNAMCSLLAAYNSLKMEAELEKMGREALPLLERVYGEDHNWTISVKKRMEQFLK